MRVEGYRRDDDGERWIAFAAGRTRSDGGFTWEAASAALSVTVMKSCSSTRTSDISGLLPQLLPFLFPAVRLTDRPPADRVLHLAGPRTPCARLRYRAG